MPKVSVVIPTYRSGPGLDRALASIERQDLGAAEVEILLLDDGSPDDTSARIEAIAAARANCRAFALEASGWPSRPRNVGVREARGEFVLFMDHDDELFPRALSAAVALAERHDADVVNVKEVRTHKPVWGLRVYGPDRSPEEARDLPGRGLLPMTPHKLYRRSFLLAHDLRFPEAPGHLWEDVFFNTEVLRHDPRVAVLGSVPAYHWRSTGENSSAAGDGFSIDYGGHDDYWPYLDRLFEAVSTLPDDALRTELLAHNTKVRLLDLLTRPDAVDADLRARVVDALARWVPVDVDDAMRPRSRRAVRLLRAGRVEEACALLGHFARHSAQAATCSIGVEVGTSGPSGPAGTVVQVRGTVRWVPTDDAAGPLWERDPATGGLRAAVPDDVRTALAALGEELASDPDAGTVTLLTRHRGTRAVWELPTTTTPRVVDGPDGPAVELDFAADLDPAAAAAGEELAPGRWDLYAVVELDDRQWVPRLRDATSGLPVDPEGGRPPTPPPGLREARFEPQRDADGRVTVIVHRPAPQEEAAGSAGRVRRALGRLRATGRG